MGWDVERFPENPDPELLCCICQGVLKDALVSPVSPFFSFLLFNKRFYRFTELPVFCFSGLYFPVFGLNTEISPYSVQMPENTDQKNSKYGHFHQRTNYLFLELIMNVCLLFIYNLFNVNKL